MPPSKVEQILRSPGSKRAVQKRLAEKNLWDFARLAWPIVEPGVEFRDGNHLHAIAEHLEAVTRGDIKKLLIQIPPRHSKSLLVCVFWFCWDWLQKPHDKWIYVSYAQSLSNRDSRKCREIIQSDWYQQNWGDRFKLKDDMNQVERFENTAQGHRIATSVSGIGMGEGADVICGDDLHKATERFSAAERQNAINCWTTTMATRGNLGVRRVVIGQRIHEGDIHGHLMSRDSGYEVLCIPAKYESDHPHKSHTSLGWKDWRQTEGELIWPQQYDEKAIADLMQELDDPYNIAGQLQQRPAPADGGLFSRDWFRYFREAEIQIEDEKKLSFELLLPDGKIRRIWADSCYWFQTVDTAMKTADTNAYTVVMTSVITPPPRCLLIYDVFRQRLPIPLQYQAIREQRQKHPRVVRQYIEDKASGIGMLQQGQIDGEMFGRLNPGNADKVRRAAAISIQCQNGYVYHKAGAPWCENFEKEILVFPAGEWADQCDCYSYSGIIFQAQEIRGRQSKGSLVFSSSPAEKPSESDQGDTKQNGNGNGEKPRQTVLERILGYQPQSQSSRFGRFEDD